jgi:pimeloyl-ACP methyl ester carboxylesterase
VNAMLPTRFVANGSIETAYYDCGNGDAFVLLHGFTGSKLDFHDQLPWFADRHRVLAPDNRGHGESSNLGNPDDYGLDVLAEDLAGFLDAMSVQRCHLLGHSMGGMVALRFALAHPGRLQSLILMDTAAEPLGLFPAELQVRIFENVRAHGCSALLDGMRARARSRAEQRGIDYLGETEHWRRIELKLTQMDPEAWVGVVGDMQDQPSLLPALGSLTMPTTILVGESDLPFIEPSANMASALPDATLVTIPLAAHCPQYENAEAWRRAIDDHLNRARERIA